LATGQLRSNWGQPTARVCLCCSKVPTRVCTLNNQLIHCDRSHGHAHGPILLVNTNTDAPSEPNPPPLLSSIVPVVVSPVAVWPFNDTRGTRQNLHSTFIHSRAVVPTQMVNPGLPQRRPSILPHGQVKPQPEHQLKVPHVKTSHQPGRQ